MKHIAISGPVAAGKSTLLELLSQRLGARADAHTERPQDNPFIREYYADSTRWSFHSQVTFLTLYFDDPGWRQDGHDFYLYDRCLVENLVIARYRLENGDLTADEYAILDKLAHGLESLMPPIDRYIYLRASVPLLLERLKQRGRAYESELGRAYAEHQTRLYEEWLATLPPEKVMIVDADSGVDIDAVLRFIGA